MNEHARKAISATLAHEGGYVNDPADPGGETKFGISKRAYPDVDIKSLTRQEAEMIYRRVYWEKAGCDKMDNSDLAIVVFAHSLKPIHATSLILLSTKSWQSWKKS